MANRIGSGLSTPGLASQLLIFFVGIMAREYFPLGSEKEAWRKRSMALLMITRSFSQQCTAAQKKQKGPCSNNLPNKNQKLVNIK